VAVFHTTFSREFIMTPSQIQEWVEGLSHEEQVSLIERARQSMAALNNKVTREEVYQAIDSEREYQIAMAEKAHGDPSNDGKKKLEEFVLYMDAYMTTLKHQLSTVWGVDAYVEPLNTLRKVVTIGVSAMEVHGAPKRVTPTKHAKGTDLTK
jgi:hypothetical protein